MNTVLYFGSEPGRIFLCLTQSRASQIGRGMLLVGSPTVINRGGISYHVWFLNNE